MSAELDPNSQEFNLAFDHAFGLVAFALNRHLIDHMLRCMRELDVDFESLVLWGLLSHLNIAHLMPPGAAVSQVLNESGRFKGPQGAIRPQRLRDLEQVSRLPRETIRRKLLRLQELGYVEQTEAGWIFSRARVDPALREFNRESARRMLLLGQEVNRLLQDGARQAAARPSP
jgi:hypothetical protein